jgi:thiosulfate reductase cytochrome b subunit
VKILLRALALAVALVLVLPAAARAQQAENPMHPLFAPLDAAGSPTRHSAEVSAQATCGACHDAGYIASHSDHAAGHARATCVQCHVDGGRLEFSPDQLDASGRLGRDALRIGAPRPASCAACHGVISDGRGPVLLPSTMDAAPATHTWSLTQGEGAIVAPQRMSDSFLDLEGKGALAIPWDVHAAKLVECTSCHFARNNPARSDDKRQNLRYVTSDPRRQSTADFLLRPDHRLAEPGCRSCHDALAAHDFLPSRERHLEVIACQTCHIPAPMGPAAEMVDATVVTPSGGPAVRYRNLERRPGEPLNAAFIRPFRPLLVERVEADGVRRLAPVNLVSRYRWVAGPGREAVPAEKVAQAFLDGDRYAPAILAGLDRDGDGQLDEAELRLDTNAKTDLVASRLAAAGVVAPAIEGTLTIHPLAHGVSPRSHALRACDDCHAEGARLSRSFPIVPYLPGGVAPGPAEGGRVTLAGKIVPTAEGGLVFERERGATPGRLHVLGATRHAWTNRLGFALFLAVALGVTVHGAARALVHRRNPRAPHAPGPDAEKVRVFGRYERLWHWTMAASGIVLVVTGVAIHNAGAAWVTGLAEAVLIHNVAAVVLSVNAFLSLFYHLATIAIRSFIPAPEGFLKRVLEHVTYQSRGIFQGAPHPTQGPTEKLNPLQQVTYLALLNLLFPLQIVSGALLWVLGRWPSLGAAIGGLSVVAPAHNLGAWVFLSFFVLHVYLVTTGRSLGDHLQSMVTGYRTVDPEEQSP